MRIGITGYPVYGGSGVVATELGLDLAGRGHEVHFITYAPPFRMPRFVEGVYYHEVEVPTYPLFEYPPYSLALSVAMQDVTLKHDLDVLHVHYAVPHATSALLAKQMLGEAAPKVVTTLHGTDITLVGQDPSYRTITRYSIQSSDAITAVSDYLRRETVARFDLAEGCIEVIPNFVDLDVYKRDARPCHRATFAQSDEERLIVHVSNFRPVKRVEDVVRVFARVAQQMPARLLLVGDGPDRGRAQRVAEEEGIDDRVVFLGKQQSVVEILSCADLFLLPSESEAFGLVALEAMACGVPVVASRVGGIPEVVQEPETGRLAAVGDVEAMAAAAVELIGDRDRWAAASHAAREAASRFSADRVVPRYEELYRRVLDA
jgi:N-acetyl-alpha-D-glucosaminyl L-malate synthase BshA